MSAKETQDVSRSPTPGEQAMEYIGEAVVPYPNGKLSPEHEAQIKAIRTALRSWLLAVSDWKQAISGSRESFRAATLELARKPA